MLPLGVLHRQTIKWYPRIAENITPMRPKEFSVVQVHLAGRGIKAGNVIGKVNSCYCSVRCRGRWRELYTSVYALGMNI